MEGKGALLKIALASAIRLGGFVLALLGEHLPFFALARRSVSVGIAGFLGVTGMGLSGLELGCTTSVCGLGGNAA